MVTRTVRDGTWVVVLVALGIACASEPDERSSGGVGGTSSSPNGTATNGGTTPFDSNNSYGGTNPSGSLVGGQPSTGGSTASTSGGTSSRVLLGAYCGNDPAAVEQFEDWLGRPVEGILGYTGAASWADYDGSVGWAVGLWHELDRRVFWSVPLIPTGATLEAAAKGDYNSHYESAAQALADYRPGDSEVYVRTGWEFNGDWFPWAAQGKAQAFIGAYRQFVNTFRTVSQRFVFEWNVNMGNNTSGSMDPAEAYPGDEYVDLIGMDFYWNTEWDPTDPIEAWDSMVTRQYGLRWHQTFAELHGKRTAYSEWGVMSNQAGPYIEQASAWFNAHQVVYQTYWNSNSAFKGKLSDDQYPNAGSAYRSVFLVP